MTMRRVAAILATVMVVAACTGGNRPERQNTPDPVGDEWTHVRPAKAGFRPWALKTLDWRLRKSNSSCFAVIRDGRVVQDSYWRGSSADKAGPVFSITKSFTSVLVGIAVDHGDLALGDRASKYIPEWRGTPSAKITIRDLLANTSGRHWDVTSDYERMVFSEPDKTAFAIGLGQDAPPGKVWVYNNSAIQTLQAVLKAATGTEPAAYGRKHIFEPLGMKHSSWATDEAGNSMTFSGVSTTCLDLARFGQMMLQHGRWNGKQIVSADYVEDATGGSSTKLNAAYGLLWWVNGRGPVLGAAAALDGAIEDLGGTRLARRAPKDTFWALGAGRQILTVIPSKSIVAVRLGVAPANPAQVTPNSFTGDLIRVLR
jgi:CubicO group peptidase (beta-lactamase class C family)